MIRTILVTALVFNAGLAIAKPLVTSSEENTARLCLAREDTPERIVKACDSALEEAGLTPTQRVELLVARADGLYWQEDYEAAAEGYRRAIEANPNSTDAMNGLAWALRDTEGDAAAYEVFSASLDLDVTTEALAGMASTGRAIGAMSEAEARGALEAAITIDPEYTWAQREIGWSYLDDGMADEAVAAFQAALEIDEYDLNGRYGLGRSLLSSGDAQAALEMFNDVLADAPDNYATKVYRIITLRELDRNAQALRDSDRLIEEYPTRNSGYIERALSLMALQRRSEAIDTFAVAIETAGESNSLLYWHADVLADDGQFEQALKVIDRALGLDGADHSDHLLKSYIALELEEYGMARTAAQASLDMGVEDPWAHYYIAISMVHSGETQDGLTQFERAMEQGLPEDRVGAFAKELISAGKYVEAAQLRLTY